MIINEAQAQTDTMIIQDSDPLPQAPESANHWTNLVPMILIFGVFYFLLIRPQEKRRRAQQDLVSGVKKGEEILTNSGMIGTVDRINDSDNTVMLSVSKGVEIKILKTSISEILSRTKKEQENSTKKAFLAQKKVTKPKK